MKIGIIICDRYKNCAGGKCFRAITLREGAFDIYEQNTSLEIVGYTSCGGCPGGNIEYAPAEMIKNGAQAIHLATGMIVGYPPCPRIDYFKKFIEEKYNIPVVYGTHPIPEKYNITHRHLHSWDSAKFKEITSPTMANTDLRKEYD